jgi:hypothetical protein
MDAFFQDPAPEYDPVLEFKVSLKVEPWSLTKPSTPKSISTSLHVSTAMGKTPDTVDADEIRFSSEFKISENVSKIRSPQYKGSKRSMGLAKSVSRSFLLTVKVAINFSFSYLLSLRIYTINSKYIK